MAQKAAGKFMCKECDAARRDYEKNTPAAPVKSPAPPAAAPDAAAKHAAPKEAPKAAAQAKVDDGGALEFTPGTDKK